MAVIKRVEKCIYKICKTQGIVLLLLIICGAGVLANPRSCDIVKKDVELFLKLEPLKVLHRPESGPICGESCCSQDLENYMHKYSTDVVDKFIKESIFKVSSILESRAKKFDDFFRGMMNNSKQEFHDMFERTYGKIYLQNSDVFSDFFNELETYYKKGTVRLSDTMDTFFGILYQRMFTVINAQYMFDDKYLECVSEHMTEMKPFGDVPHKLGMQLRRSFVATRTFYKSLVKGTEAANKLSDLKIDADCYNEVTKMRFCAICKGENSTEPCSNYCTNTLQQCLRYHTEISSKWDNFVDAVDKVGDRLLGPYNIEIVVEPLNIKISEAVMNFQESGTEVSQKIYGKCGKPSLNRPKRKVDNYKHSPEGSPNMEITIEPIKMHGRKKHKKIVEAVDTKSTLEKIIADIKQKIKETKQFWLNLPYQYCNNLSILKANDTNLCWNGTAVGPFDKPQRKFNIGESHILNEQVYVLEGLTDKLRKAYHGQEVEMVDDTEEPLVGSGSGSGDGSFEDIGEKDLTFNENKEEVVDVFPTPFVLSSTRAPEVPASSADRNSISLTRALIQYLLPMVLVWFGGAITNLL